MQPLDSNPLVQKFKTDSHYITPSMRREIYNYMQSDSVPLKQVQQKVEYGSKNDLTGSFEAYKRNKQDFIKNRAQDYKTTVDLSKLFFQFLILFYF